MWWRQGTYNDRRPYVRLKCVAQKRLCLGSLLTVHEDRQMYPSRQRFILIISMIYYMAKSASRQDEANHVLWLANRAGKIGPS